MAQSFVKLLHETGNLIHFNIGIVQGSDASPAMKTAACNSIVKRCGHLLRRAAELEDDSNVAITSLGLLNAPFHSAVELCASALTVVANRGV